MPCSIILHLPGGIILHNPTRNEGCCICRVNIVEQLGVDWFVSNKKLK